MCIRNTKDLISTILVDIRSVETNSNKQTFETDL